MKKRFACLLLACLLVTMAATPAAHAVTSAPSGTLIFEAVDGVTVRTGATLTFLVEGLLQGEAEPKELGFRIQSNGGPPTIEERCLKLALMVQSKPGRYALELKVASDSFLTSCKLKSR